MTKNYLESLNEEQKNAVLSPLNEPLFICAGAGSGKTRTLICRIAYMIDSSIEPSQILALTFTRKAADEIRERLKAFVGPKAENVITSTFHQFCLMLIKENPFILGFSSKDKDKDFHIADNTAQRIIMRKTVNALKKRSTERKKELSTPTIVRNFVNKMLNFVNRAKMLQKDPSLFPGDYPFILKFYNDQLKKRRLIDFNDFLTITRDLLMKHQSIARKYREKYKYILIDEFQDTSDLNFEVLKLLLQQSMSNEPPNQCITIVGDPHQSIYGFRGANPDNIKQFKALFPDAKEICLNKNYRTSEAIINAANSLISRDVDLNSNSSNIEAVVKGGLLTKYIVANDAYGEADSICTEIERLVYPGSEFQYRDITIMFRMRKSSAEVEMELFRRGIPYTHKRGTSFYMRNEVREVVSYCRLFLNFNSSMEDENKMLSSSFEMAVNAPDRQIRHCVIEQLIDESETRKINILKHLKDVINGDFTPSLKNYPKATLKKLADFYHLIEKLYIHICVVNQHLATDTIIEIILQMTKLGSNESEEENEDDSNSFQNQDIDEFLEPLNETNNDRTETIALLLQEARRFHMRLIQIQSNDSQMITSEENIKKFIDSITLESTSDYKRNAVTLSTIHQMKGLESPICFLIRFNEGVLPVQENEQKADSNILEQEVSIDEERRIAYVAMTRAKARLFISCCLSYRGRDCEPSRFINEIGMKNLTKNIDLTIEEKEQLEIALEYDDSDSFDFSFEKNSQALLI